MVKKKKKKAACNEGDSDLIVGLRRVPWTEKPGELQSMKSQSVGHDRVTFTSLGLKFYYLQKPSNILFYLFTESLEFIAVLC